MFLVAHQKSTGNLNYNYQKTEKAEKLNKKDKDREKEKKEKKKLLQTKQTQNITLPENSLSNSLKQESSNLNQQNKQPYNLKSSNANTSKSQTDTQIITISNNSNPSNFAKGTGIPDPNAAPVPKTIQLRLSVIRAPHANPLNSISNPSKVNNLNNSNANVNNAKSQNSILSKNENNLSAASLNNNLNNGNFLMNKGKSIFTTTPFVRYNTPNSASSNNSSLGIKPQISSSSLASQSTQAKSFLNAESQKQIKSYSAKNLNTLNNNIINSNSNNNPLKSLNSNTNFFNSTSNGNINSISNNLNNSIYNSKTNKNLSSSIETKNNNNNINININTGMPCNAENCFWSPKTSSFNSKTNNILINTNNILNSKSPHYNSTNNININITNNSFPSGSEPNSIININNYCSGTAQAPQNQANNNESLLNNANNNTNNNSNINNLNNNSNINTNPSVITLGNFNTSLFQSLAAIDYKDPEKKKIKKRLKEMRIKHKRLNREGSYNCGRWQPEEHERFIEAIMKFGNEWKQVQKYVGTRSSTQARSHAQKFFVKIKRANILDFNIDLSKNSIKNLHEMANNLNSDQYVNAIKALNCVAFERKTNSNKRKNKKDEQNMFDSNINMSDECDGKINLISDDIQATMNENTFIFGNSEKNLFNKFKSFLGNQINNSNNNNTNSNVKIMTSEYEDIRKTSINLDFKPTNAKTDLITNNNINLISQNTRKGTNTGFNFSKYEQSMLRKRTRLSSFEGFWNNIDFENLGYNHKKSIDEVEILNSFGKEIKYDFNEEELEVFDECLKNSAGFKFEIETKTREQANRRRSFRHKISDVDFCATASTSINNNLNVYNNPIFSSGNSNNAQNARNKQENKEQLKDDDDIFLKFLV